MKKELKKHIKILENYNNWRRGEIEAICYTPTEIGISIDYCLKKLKKICIIKK